MSSLVPLGLQLAPELGKWLFGVNAEAIAAAVAAAVSTATGTTDIDVARAFVAREQGATDSLRLDLARIAADAEEAQRGRELAVLKAYVLDIATGQQQSRDLVRPISGAAWGPPIVSLVVLLTFGMVMWAAMTQALPAGSETMVNLLMGTLAAMASSVVAYWVGSSAGSASKTAMLFHSQPILTPP